MLIAAVVFLAAIAGVWAGRELFPSPPSPGVELHSLLHDGLELDEAQRTKLQTLGMLKKPSRPRARSQAAAPRVTSVSDDSILRIGKG